MIQNFDAFAERCRRLIAQEEKHAADFEKSRSIQLEISSQHCWTLERPDSFAGESPKAIDGITYFYLHNGDLEIGQYYKDPWGSGWYWQSSVTGEKNHCPSKAIALTNIQKQWLRWCR